MKFYIKTFGCQMNVNDSEKMRDILMRRGFTHSQTDQDADIVILNSCAVRQKPQDKIFSYAGRWGKQKKIIVAGCVAQSERENILARNPNINFVVGTHQYYKIDRVVDEILEHKSRGTETAFSREWQEAVPHNDARHTPYTAFISIMEGCDNFCSYCIVPFTRGREKHRPFDNIMQEARHLTESGYKEIILLGQNVNSWEDPARNMKFVHLLDRMASEIQVPWIRFITSYPGYHDEGLVEVMAKHRRVARSIHFPAQSGSTRVLKKMNRRYDRKKYLDIIRRFKNNVPGMTFSSDFIVGYPGETDHDFELTLSLVEKVEYEIIYSFMYNPRKHTKAYKMADNIPLQVKKERLYRLQDLQEKIQLKNNSAVIGQTVDVLVTGPNLKRPGEVIARTESYRVVNFHSTTPAGEFTKVLVDNVGPHSLRGSEIKPG